MIPRPGRACLLLLLLGAALPGAAATGPLGLFTGQADIGRVSRPGTAAHDPATGAYTVGGSGENMWFARDDFHFVWTKAAGDVALAADIAMAGTGGNAHRKAVLMIRQSLDTDSVYADAALHGDGLTSLQFREEPGGPTREVQASLSAPRRLRIERTGDMVHLSAAAGDDDGFRPTGCSVRLALTGEFYIGIGVCAHDNNAFEQAVFTRVAIGAPPQDSRAIRSAIETVPIASGDRRCVRADNENVQAVRWTADGKALLFDRNGRTLRLPLSSGAEPEPAAAAAARQDTAAVSPDGQTMAEVVSGVDEPGDVPWCAIRLRPTAGGESRLLVKVTGTGHTLGPPAWSPDGARLAYVRTPPSFR